MISARLEGPLLNPQRYQLPVFVYSIDFVVPTTDGLVLTTYFPSLARRTNQSHAEQYLIVSG